MSKKVMDFQRATADRIADIFREGKQRRVLLADEVGLGKTIMARAVIDRVREIRRSVNDDMFRVVYVCSNLNIIKQNMYNLGVKETLNMTEGRLSMQHFSLERQMKTFKDKEEYGEGKMPELLIPLTPGTSFNMTSALGSMPERALLYNLVVKMEEFKDDTRCLCEIFKSKLVKREDSWLECVKSYKKV